MVKLNKKILVIGLLIAAFCAVLKSDIVHGWAGGAGGSISACTSGLCYGPAGVTWAYYKYTDSYAGGELVLPNVRLNDSADHNGGRAATVSRICKSYGGFYLLGYLQYVNNGSLGGLTGVFGSATDHNEMTDDLKYKWNHGYVEKAWIDANIYLLGDMTYVGGNVLYSMTHEASIIKYGESDAVIKSRFESMDNDAKMGYDWDTVSAFCYNEKKIDDDDNKSTFEGKAEVSYGGSTKSTGWQSQNSSADTLWIPCENNCSVDYTYGEKRISGDKTGEYNVTLNGQGFDSGNIGGDEISKNKKSNVEVGNEICLQNNFSASIINSEKSFATVSACAAAPYNFNTDISSGFSDIVYAGETGNITIQTKTTERENQTLGKTYASSTSNEITRVQTIMYIDGEEKGENWSYSGNVCDYFDSSCEIVSDESGKNLSTRGYDGRTSINIDIPDIEAGSRICVAAAVYPASSGNNDLQMDASGSQTWHISASKCAIVAKKPNFQVWGGSDYAAGDIAAQTTIKNKRFFGSWAELGVVANGTNRGLASGASLSDVFGGSFDNFCYYNPLTIANQGCALGNSGINAKMANKSSLLEKFKEQTENVADGQVSGVGEFSGVKVLKASGDTMAINGNIILNNKEVGSIDEASILIIYAQNINISCGVTRVDAILIAESTINTCFDSGEDMQHDVALNSAARSNQLIINGALIADYLELGRTYGAGTGLESGVPAEIINASTGFYLWGAQASEESDQLYTSYIRDVSPRY